MLGASVHCERSLLAGNLSRFATPAAGAGRRTAAELVQRWFIAHYVAPNPEGTRARAPKKIEPAKTVDADVLASFLRSNRRARELVLRASEYDVNAIRFRNPFIPLLRFTVGTGLEIISKHESRHLLQAEGVKRSAGFPR
jgi:hypothetical protein